MNARAELLALAERVERGNGEDNALDVLCEVALFKPSQVYSAVRANAAGTKVIYTQASGADDVTAWAMPWTRKRRATAAALRVFATRSTDQ